MLLFMTFLHYIRPHGKNSELYRQNSLGSNPISCCCEPTIRQHRRSQGFCLGGGGNRPTPPSLASVVHTFEAVVGSWRSVSAPADRRGMGGAQERGENSKK